MSLIVNPYRFGGGGPPPGDNFWAVTSFSLDGSGVTSGSRFGWVFVPTENLSCNALRVQTSSNGTTERVIIHRNSDDAVIATADIDIASDNSWMSQIVTPFSLSSGIAYTISTRITTGGTRSLRRNNAISFDSRVTDSNPGQSVVIGGGSDDRPTTTTAASYRSMDFGYV